MTSFSRLLTVFSLTCLIALPGCSRIGGWFTPEQPDTLEPEEGYGPIIVDRRGLVASVTALRAEPTPGGLIVLAEGLPPSQGYWDVDLVQVTADDTPSSELRYEFRVRPPASDQPPGTEQSRDLEAATFLTTIELQGIRRITVIGQANSRSIKR